MERRFDDTTVGYLEISDIDKVCELAHEYENAIGDEFYNKDYLNYINVRICCYLHKISEPYIDTIIIGRNSVITNGSRLIKTDSSFYNYILSLLDEDILYSRKLFRSVDDRH